MAKKELVNMGGRMVESWVLEKTSAEQLDNLESLPSTGPGDGTGGSTFDPTELWEEINRLSSALSKAEARLALVSNPNLLDNWYFIGGGSQQGGGQFPINQRGQTEYTGSGYAIDRWYVRNSNTKITLVENGLKLEVAGSGEYRFTTQRFENYEPLLRKMVTISIYVSEVSEDIGRGLAFSIGSANSVGTNSKGLLGTGYIKSPGVYSISGILPSTIEHTGLNAWFVFENGNPVGSYVVVGAVKLELGSVQTLARQDADGNWVLNDPPPNFALELAKCQRYQIPIANYSRIRAVRVQPNVITFPLRFPSTMRATPTLQNTENILLYSYSDNIKQSGFSILAAGTVSPGYMNIHAEKQNHGLTDAHLVFASHSSQPPTPMLDANL